MRVTGDVHRSFRVCVSVCVVFILDVVYTNAVHCSCTCKLIGSLRVSVRRWKLMHCFVRTYFGILKCYKSYF